MIVTNSIQEAIPFTPPSTSLAAASSSITATAPSSSHIDTRSWQTSTSSIIAARHQHAWLLDAPNNDHHVTSHNIDTTITDYSPSSSLYLSAATKATEEDWTQQLLSQSNNKQITTTTDKVKRVIDSSTILLEKSGIVSLDIVRGAGSTYVLPECCTYAPAYKLKQLLKRDTKVKIVNLNSGNTNSNSEIAASSARPKVWIIRSSDDLIINREIARTGFGFVRKGSGALLSSKTRMDASSSSTILANYFDYEGMINEMTHLEESARSGGMGIFKQCDGSNTINNEDGNVVSTSNFIAEFEPLEYTTEIQYGDDGGKSVLVSNSDKLAASAPPPNPGDVRGCSDFATYEDALGYYERFYPYYGDVAKLDRDGDGVPCPGLPHTSNQDKYRMKLPNR